MTWDWLNALVARGNLIRHAFKRLPPMPTSIKTIPDFLQNIVAVDVQEALDNPLDLRLLHHAAISLYSLRDWVFQEHAGKAWTFNGQQQPVFNSTTALENSMVNLEPAFQYVIDIANAVKHRVLTRRKRTALWGAANSEIRAISTQLGGSVFGAFALNTTAFNQVPINVHRDLAVLDIGGNDVPLLPQLLRSLQFWVTAIQENAW